MQCGCHWCATDTKNISIMKAYLKTSWTGIKDSVVLYQDKRWSIELSEDKEELHITNGNDICYAYFDSKNNKLLFDRIACPLYIQIKALSLANKYMISIYNTKH